MTARAPFNCPFCGGPIWADQPHTHHGSRHWPSDAPPNTHWRSHMVRFGKHPPVSDYRTLRMADYLGPALPPPPAAYSALDRVYANLKAHDPSALFPMDGNDQYGDCTIAGLAHAETVYAGLVGKHHMMTAAAVKKLYFQLSGGVDSGLNELDVLNYWRKHSVSSDRILGFASVKPHNHDHVKQAISMFGGAYIGFQVQEDAIKDFDARKPWTPGTLTNDGHAVFAVAYDADTVTVLTWGNTQQGTWGWWDQCVDEAWAILPQAAADPKFCPGFNSAQLLADLGAVAA